MFIVSNQNEESISIKWLKCKMVNAVVIYLNRLDVD